MKHAVDAEQILKQARPLTAQQAHEIQPFNHLVRMPIALDEQVCRESVENLNQVLADTITLRDLYKKHHWQVAGPTFYSLHLLFDKHAGEQDELVDALAERIQLLRRNQHCHGAQRRRDVTHSARAAGRESVPVQISRLLHAQEIIIREARSMAHIAADKGDDGTNDLLISDVVRANELQSWLSPSTSWMCRSCAPMTREMT